MTPDCRDDYQKAGYGELWDLMAERCEYVPSFEVFSTGLFKNPTVSPHDYADGIARHYNRTIC